MLSDGAFVLSEWVQGAYVLARRNHYYWNDAATRLDAVKYLLIPDENAELARYRGGELQVTFVVPRGQFDWIRAHLGAELHIAPQLTTYYYGFNLRRAPFKDAPEAAPRAVAGHRPREARHARAARRRAARLRLGAAGRRSTTPRSPSTTGACPCRSASPRRSGCTARPATRGSTRSRFELRYNAGEVHTKLALAIASMWKEALGAEVRLTQVEFKSLLQDIDRGDVEMFRSSWVGDYNDAYTFAQYLKSDFGVNLPRYASPRYDALLAQAAASARSATRARGCWRRPSARPLPTTR